MSGKDIDSIVNQAQEEQQSVTDLAQQTVDWFISDKRIGNAYPIEEATQELCHQLDVGYHEASRAISSVVGDIVDPVQLITLSDGKYVGVFEYNIYSDSGAYGYIHYDDRFGKLRRVVCAKCVQEHILDENVTHATQGMGTASGEASWGSLVNKIEQHYHNAHKARPEDIEPGATLVSGTTISGNTAFHTGNESSITHDNISGGTSGNPHSDSLSTSYTAPVQDVNGNTGSVTISVPVDSVNGETGAVTLSAADVNALSDTYTAPVQSVNSQTGDVTISTGSAIGGSVTNYSDLPFDLSERQLYYVSSEEDVVVQTNAGLNIWKSISDFTTVASAIPDSVVSRPDDTDSGDNEDLGLKFTTSQEWPDFQARISSLTSPNSTAEMYIGDSNGNDIVAKDISSKSSGDVVTLSNANLSANTSYQISIRTTDGSNMTYGFVSASFPYTSSDGNLTIDTGWSGGSTNSIFAYMIKEIGNINL